MKLLIYILCLTQLQSDWDVTAILQDMQQSWSVGNGCLQSNYKVINTNGLELNGNTLEIMDARIQVFGDLTNYGEVIDINNDLILYACSNSELVVYSEVLNIQDNRLETPKIYHNPVKYTLNISYSNLEDYMMYNINGEQVLKGTDNTIDVSTLSDGLYFLIINKKTTFKIIKQ